MMCRVLFMGRKAVAAEALAWLAERSDVEVVGVLTDSHLEKSKTREVAEALAIPVLDFAELEMQLVDGAFQYDLGLSVLYWRKLTPAFIAAPERGNINFHPAPLPAYKGTAGYNLAILEGRQSWAVSAHYMDEGIDTGGIIDVAEFAIDRHSETAVSLEATSTSQLLAQFKEIVAAALASATRLPTTPNVGGRYVSRKEMEAMKLVEPGDDVSRKIRAFWFPPYDGACLEIEGTRYTLVNRQILESLADPEASSLFSGKAKT